MLVESTVLLQGAVNGAADTGCDAVVVERASQVGLVEEREDVVAFLETGDAGADGFDHTGAVGGWDYAVALGEGVKAFDNGEVAVVEGGGVDWAVLVPDARTRMSIHDRDLRFTKTSFSPILGTAASVASLRPSKPLVSATVHCF